MRILAGSFLGFVAVSWGLRAQGPFWVEITGSGPPAQESPVMVYDTGRSRLVLFGEHGTWERTAGSWVQAATTGPSARRFHAMAHDALRGRTVLFGGLDATGHLRDTWEWDGLAWTQRQVPGPLPRIHHAMTQHRDLAVLFGGYFSDGTCLRDTYVWTGAEWRLAASTGPAARMGHALSYDVGRSCTVLFGGWNCDQTQFGDVWEWNGANWRLRAATGPAARDRHAMAYDPGLGRTVLFGGHVSALEADTWTWDGTNWTQLTIAGPAPRETAAMAFDAAAGRTVLFGGVDGGSLIQYGDTWELGSTFAATAVPFGNGCGSPALSLVGDPGARPVVGTSGGALVGHIPAALAFVAVGWSRTRAGSTPLPMSLAGHGMPGCELLQSTDELAFVTTSAGGGNATFALPIPASTALVGLRVYLQAWAAAPGANAASLVVSNGLEWFVGNA